MPWELLHVPAASEPGKDITISPLFGLHDLLGFHAIFVAELANPLLLKVEGFLLVKN